MKNVHAAIALATGLLSGCATEDDAVSADEAALAVTPTPGVLYNLINETRGFVCLAGRSNDKTQTSTCNDAFSDQFWQLVPAGAAGYYQFVVQSDGRCMAFTSSRDSTEGRVSTCVASFTDQWWRPEVTLDPDRFMLRNFATNKCLVLRSGATVATESGCTLSFTDQWWTFFPRS
jgi:hypothetical protein